MTSFKAAAARDWIFGNEGFDVLTGGADRNASDLLFGGPGDDTFQIIPDALPLLGNQPNTVFDPATETFIPTYSEQLDGGEGNDRVLFLGGDTDRRGFDVPDYASLRYNTLLGRYEFTSLVWDIGEQEFRTETNADGEVVYEQEFMFYQARNIEETEFNTRKGDDAVRLDPEFQFAPLAEGLTARYRFNDGTADDSSNDNDGTLENGATIGFDAVLGASVVELDGVDDYVDIPDTVLNATAGSVSAWFKVTDATAQQYVFGNRASDRVYLTVGNGTLNANLHGAGSFGDTAIENGEWYHATLTWNESGVGELFVNGDTRGTVSGIAFTESQLQRSVSIGSLAQGTARFFGGSIADVQIYDNALSGDQVRTLMQTGLPGLAATGTEAEEWGIDPGDFQQGARIAAVRVLAGEGNDALYGGSLDDTLDGGPGNDYLQGGLGNDRVIGGGGADQIFGHTPDASEAVNVYPVAPPVPEFFGLFDFEPEAFTFELAAPFLELTLPGREGVDLYGPQPQSADDEAFAFEGANDLEQLGDIRPVGDFFADGTEDFLVSGTAFSYLVEGSELDYLLNGPLNPHDIYNVADYAAIVIDHSTMGLPGDNFGDINGDGAADLTFVRHEGSDILVTLVFGGEDAGGNIAWPRLWSDSFVADVLDGTTNSRTIRLRNTPLSGLNGGVSVSTLDLTGDGMAEVAIAGSSTHMATNSVANTFNTGYVFSGDEIVAFTPSAEQPDMHRADRLARIRSLDDLPLIQTLAADDLNGDSIEDLLFGNASLDVNVDVVTPAVLTAPEDVQVLPGFASNLDITLGPINETFLIEHIDGPDSGSTFDGIPDLVDIINQKIENSSLAYLLKVEQSGNQLVFTTDEGGSDVVLTVDESPAQIPSGFSAEQSDTASRNWEWDESTITFVNVGGAIRELESGDEFSASPPEPIRIVAPVPSIPIENVSSQLTISYDEDHGNSDFAADEAVTVRPFDDTVVNEVIASVERSPKQKEVVVRDFLGVNANATVNNINQILAQPENLKAAKFSTFSTFFLSSGAYYFDPERLYIDDDHSHQRKPVSVRGLTNTAVGASSVDVTFTLGLFKRFTSTPQDSMTVDVNLSQPNGTSFSTSVAYTRSSAARDPVNYTFNFTMTPQQFENVNGDWIVTLDFNAPSFPERDDFEAELAFDVPFAQAGADGDTIYIETVNTPSFYDGLSAHGQRRGSVYASARYHSRT